jgi:hypothetical protein
MMEDYYIRFSSASRNEGDVHTLLVEPRERVDALLPLLHTLIQSESKPGDRHDCPICGQTIEVSFSRYPQIAKTISISTNCDTCNIIVLFESNKIPAWISEYGSLLEKIRKREK